MSIDTNLSRIDIYWHTPEWLIKALTTDRCFDLDPCAPPSPRPCETAKITYDSAQDGLALPWSGPWCYNCGAVSDACIAATHCISIIPQPYRVWLNPPLIGAGLWLEKLAAHRHGLAFIFARPDSVNWHTQVWPKAHSVFFFEGDITRQRYGLHADYHSVSGHPQALISYSYFDTCQIELAWENGGIKGTLVKDWTGRLANG